MMRPGTVNDLRPGATATTVALLVVVGVLLVVGVGSASAANGPTVSITPAPTKGAFADQQVVRIAVPPNSLFTPNSRVVILECTDPGGSVTNLPLSYSSCDGNTIQPDTTVVHADGSLVEPSYTVYALPSAVLGEQANWQPVCNAVHPCVLFIGQDQNDFSKAKVFSAAFTISGGGAPATSAGTTTTTVGTSPAPASASAAVSLPATQLAFTGASGWLLLLAIVGSSLVLVAWMLVTLVRRSAR
jgi:hypothetical protein